MSTIVFMKSAATITTQDLDGDTLYTVRVGMLTARATKYAFNGKVGLWSVESPRSFTARMSIDEIPAAFLGQGKRLAVALKAVAKAAEKGRI
ncbi:hypothetical protein WMF30_40060 [Sorangium sp. So ce134]